MPFVSSINLSSLRRSTRLASRTPAETMRLKRMRREKANDRERQRMHALNEALEKLRDALPAFPDEETRLTKIETLRFAQNYIWALTESARSLEAGCMPPAPPHPRLAEELRQAAASGDSEAFGRQALQSCAYLAQTMLSQSCGNSPTRSPSCSHTPPSSPAAIYSQMVTAASTLAPPRERESAYEIPDLHTPHASPVKETSFEPTRQHHSLHDEKVAYRYLESASASASEPYAGNAYAGPEGPSAQPCFDYDQHGQRFQFPY